MSVRRRFFCLNTSNSIHPQLSVKLSILLPGVIFLSQHVGSIRIATPLLGASNSFAIINGPKETYISSRIFLLFSDELLYLMDDLHRLSLLI